MLDEEAPYPRPVDLYKDKSQPQQTEATNSSYNNMNQLSPCTILPPTAKAHDS